VSIFNFRRKQYAFVWKNSGTFTVGGLENIGFAPGTDLLLVLSSMGEGIFDCIKGERIARVHNNLDWWDRFNSEAANLNGFDILENTEIVTCGMYGKDNLAKVTADGWRLEITGPKADDKPFEKYLVKRIYLRSPDKKQKIFIDKNGACELRAFGFSETGKSLVVALSCNLTIFSRV